MQTEPAGPTEHSQASEQPPKEVILFQMGKVASTAIAQTLRTVNVNAYQAHLASLTSLKRKMTDMFWPGMPQQTAWVLYQGFLQELEVGFKIARSQSPSNAGGPVTILSPFRDPLTWYFSHFAEVYYHYKNELHAFWKARGFAESEFEPRQAFIELLRNICRVLDRTSYSLEDPDQLEAIKAEALDVDTSGMTTRQIDRFLLPLRWFSEEFYRSTGIDVYDHEFDRENGIGVIDSDGYQIILARYEDLEALFPAICELIGVQPLPLHFSNVSSEKDIPFSMSEIRKNSAELIGEALSARINASRYAYHFGYSVD